MADNLFYHFSDEDGEDALLDRAYDRWEQLGGGLVRGPLFQFTMQPIGRRCRWREVVERAQFSEQLRQLRDPVAGDNIGMALTEALHRAIETELEREQRPAYHFVNFAITAHGLIHAYQTANFTVGEFFQRTSRLDEMLATLAGEEVRMTNGHLFTEPVDQSIHSYFGLALVDILPPPACFIPCYLCAVVKN